jgi:hypothetical protein
MQWQTYTLLSVARLFYYMRAQEMTENVVAVLAFKTVYTLELKRRENDKKIIALYVEMKDMMGALLM